MRDEFLSIPDPLTLDSERQLQQLLNEIPPASAHAQSLRHVSSPKELLSTLSDLLSVPYLTSAIATHFRPLLLDLCARWLDSNEGVWSKFQAFCLLIEIHEEIYPYVPFHLTAPTELATVLASCVHSLIAPSS